MPYSQTPRPRPRPRPRHIAAGCLRINQEQSHLSGDQWSSAELQQWARFSRHDRIIPKSDSEPSRSYIDLSPNIEEVNFPQLPHEVQDILLKHSSAPPLGKLFRHHWIELEFRVSLDRRDTGIFRVHLLPDDVDRRLINRSNAALRKDWNLLLSLLDFSRLIWGGECDGPPLSQPLASYQGGLQGNKYDGTIEGSESGGTDETDKTKMSEERSLLQLFNEIPSPNPQPQLLLDSSDRDYSYGLLASNIVGLRTELYPYQRRSAALMLEREVQPAQILDPRLARVVDHNGSQWYYDAVTGAALRDARFYDGISGGILAEEMGAGKTLICLSLILATRHQPAYIPEICGNDHVEIRPRVGSLADMAAAAGSRASVPWGLYLDSTRTGGLHYTNCLEIIKRNPGYYLLQRPELRRKTRQPLAALPPIKVYLSRASLIIVPTNLLQQWKDEIAKHTSDLKVLVLAAREGIPSAIELLEYDLVLFSISRFERLLEQRRTDQNSAWMLESPIAQVHFKRIIVDEGHKLGNSKIGKKSNILLLLEHIQTSARWIVTGTPSTGLFGVDDAANLNPSPASDTSGNGNGNGSKEGKDCASQQQHVTKHITESSDQQERKDLERLGSIASLYLKARPWANTLFEDGDTPADWSVYVMQKKHGNRSRGRYSVLKATLESLIIRHRKSEIGDLLPQVNEKLVYLDGSYQDKLALNLFSMMIISNAVQSQRTDQDFFFHPRQRKSLLQLVSNQRQASFFGGSFFSTEDVSRAVETAEKFLAEKKVPISADDERLLRDAVAFGKIAVQNKLKDLGNRLHEMPVYVQDFPGKEHADALRSWSLDGSQGGEGDLDLVCTDAPMILALQRFIRPWLSSPEALRIVFESGTFAAKGEDERLKTLAGEGSESRGQAAAPPPSSATLAGNTKPGSDWSTPKKARPATLAAPAPKDEDVVQDESEIAEALAGTRLVSTASAKLSYLLDSIIRHQDGEKIIVFYESENVAWHLAGFLEILHIRHLIYAKSLTPERRAQYIATFNESAKFRVMLMDLTQAAFGLDMRSASRIYFINPVLNPQVEAQAIGRVRRISQKKQVSVETLVLRGSLEELIIERRQKMTQAEHRKIKSILDDRPIYDWLLNARIAPLPAGHLDGPAQMAPLAQPQPLFGRASGKVAHPDEDLVMRMHNGGSARVSNGHTPATAAAEVLLGRPSPVATSAPPKRPHSDTDMSEDLAMRPMKARRPVKGVRFAGITDDDGD